MRAAVLRQRRLKPDMWLTVIVFLLTATGLFVIRSSTVAAGIPKPVVQSFAAAIGVLVSWLVSRADFGIVKRGGLYLYIASVFILVFVLLFGSGREETGANSWIRFGGIGIQPSELVKIAFAVILAERVDAAKAAGVLNKPKTVAKLFPLFSVLCGLVILQNDTGTALVFAFMFCVTLFVAGISRKYIWGTLVFAAFASPVAWFLLAPYQRERILVFFMPERDPMGAGYQVLQSKLSVSSGGFWGRGYMKGPQNRLSMLPEKETDFIFGVIGEEFGFLGAFVLSGLLIALVFRCFQIARHAPDGAGRYRCVAIGAMFFFHVAENICMCLGLLPVTGIPLPFLSYGGSAMVTCFLAVGVVQSTHIESKKLCFYSKGGTE